MPEGVVVLRDQPAALARVDELADGELWRADRRAVALAVLRGLVSGMSWESGLVAGVTRTQLARVAGCSPRTVSRVVAWAQEVGLLVCVETGATAEFLGTETNRAPSYVLTAPVGAGPVERLGNPPASSAKRSNPRQEQELEDRQDENHHDHGGNPHRRDTATPQPWPVFDLAKTPPDRARAVATLLERAEVAGRVVRWRAVAMLGPWFEAGWCVAGLLHALDHHPDRPGLSRGDAARAARDPLRVLGHRLGPWRGRLGDLPAGLVAVDGHARRARVATLAEADSGPDKAMATVATATGDRPWPTTAGRPRASSETRAAARAQVSRVLSRPRHYVAATGGSGRSPGTRGGGPGVVDH